jgi:hypothetical protein
MTEVIRHAETCTIKMEKNSKETPAVVQSFEYQSKLSVIINKSVKLHMVWNGRCYEGRSAGMDFVSDGPAISKTSTTSRG